MKLRYARTSPFARKVLIAAHELGLADRIEVVQTDPHNDKASLVVDNPLMKVPALALDDGSAIFDSPVICEYLDHLAGGGRLFPPAGPQRWSALVLMAAADGIADAAVLRRMESLRPEAMRLPDFIARQKDTMERGVDFLESHAGEISGKLTIGSIAVAAALGYLDLRFGDEPWRPAHPGLATWMEEFANRPSFQATRP